MFNRIYMYLLGALSLVLGAIGLYWKGKSQGKKEERVEALEEAVENVQKAKANDKETEGKTSDELDDIGSEWLRNDKD